MRGLSELIGVIIIVIVFGVGVDRTIAWLQTRDISKQKKDTSTNA